MRLWVDTGRLKRIRDPRQGRRMTISRLLAIGQLAGQAVWER